VLIAPGDRHMTVRRSAAGLCVRLLHGPPVNRHKPSVDVLFDSVAADVGRDAVGVILTGMGDDGARGLLRMREAGAQTLAQDEETCIVYGMPREAVRLGAVARQLPLGELSSAAHDACVRT
jgi:two-component system chemotaxis response regulator CheB